MKLYHKDVYMPNIDFNKFWANFERINFTIHFLQRARQKRLPLVQKDRLSKATIFEVGVQEGKVVKVAVRIPMRQCDFCYVVGAGGQIITGWRNHKGDCHKKLNKERYVQK